LIIAPEAQDPNGRGASGTGHLLYLFEAYEFDTGTRELKRGTGVIPIEPHVFDLLVFLIDDKTSRAKNPPLSALVPKRKKFAAQRNDAMCQKQTFRHSFDHLVGAGQQRRQHGQPERLRGLEVDHQFVLGRRLHWMKFGPYEVNPPAATYERPW
jgi:hypothetical protein